MIRASVRLSLIALWCLVASPLPIVAALLTLGSRAAAARTGPILFQPFAKGLCAILGIRVRRAGEPPRGAAFVAPNHWGYVDVVVLGSLYRSVFVSRADVAKWPVVGLFARAGGTLFLRREVRRDTARVGDEIDETLRRGVRVTAFLEGGAGDGKTVRRFRSALLQPAAATGTPAVPVAIRYTLPANPELDPGTAVSWIDDDFAGHAWRLLAIRRIDATVTFLPPRSGTDRKELARRLEEDVREAVER